MSAHLVNLWYASQLCCISIGPALRCTSATLRCRFNQAYNINSKILMGIYKPKVCLESKWL